MMNLPTGGSTKRTIALLAAILCTVTAFLSFLAPAQTSTQRGKIAAEFQNPERQYRPHMRMWIPQAAVDESTLRNQVNDLADAGFGDVELVAFDLTPRAAPRAPPPR